MPISNRFSALSFGLLLLVASSPSSAVAAGNAGKPAGAPKPDVQRKVWTNDEVERLNPNFSPVAAKRADGEATSAPAAVAPAAEAASASFALVAPLPPEKDPAVYGHELTVLQSQLADVEAHEAALRNFRSTGATAGTGLMLNAPCTGITTDNLIANLEAQRQGILAQIDALGDRARINGLPAGTLVEGRGLVQPGYQPSADEQRSAVSQVLQEASSQLADVQAKLAAMRAQAAALHITLQPPALGGVGSMTADLLSRLNGQAASLQNAIDDATDTARSLGMAPGELR